MTMLATLRRLALLPLCGACSLFGGGLPDQSPALRDMEEPLDLRAEPDDEATRLALPKGSFSGIYVRDARDTLAAKLDEPDAVEVERVVENSPADRAGVEPGDLVLGVTVGADWLDIRRPSDWRRLELELPPGTKVKVLVDRAGREAHADLELVARVRATARQPVERYREEQKVGVVLRTATEVEARAAGLGPGGGAVVVGLSARSPWRTAGLRFGDLLVAIDERPVAHPEDVLDALRADDRERVALTFVRDGERTTLEAPLSARAQELTEVSIPLVFSYESDRGRTGWSLLLGLLGYDGTEAAWRCRVLWLITFGGGDADQLLETGS